MKSGGQPFTIKTTEGGRRDTVGKGRLFVTFTGQTAFGAQRGKSPLPERLVGPDGHGVGQIEGTGRVIVQHRKTDAPLPVGRQKGFGKSGRLLAENELRAVGIDDVGVDRFSLGGEIEKRAVVPREKVIEIFIIGDMQQMPVIQPRPLKLPVIDGKPERPH